MDSCRLRRIEAEVADGEADSKFPVSCVVEGPSLNGSVSNVLGSSVVS
jgi:hypothetical protein